MSAGYSGTPLARKLGIREGDRVAMLGAPAGFAALLEPLPASVRLHPDLRGAGRFDILIVFVRTPSELRRRFDQARRRLEQSGGLWVSWPKQSSPLASGLREADVRAHGLAAGLVDNKVCAVDEDWSALRFVVRLRDRA